MRVPYLTQKLILGGGKVECDPINKSRGLDIEVNHFVKQEWHSRRFWVQMV